MSLANRPTTTQEAELFRLYGFRTSPFESLDVNEDPNVATRGNWSHPSWTPDGHVGPDEVLKIIEAHKGLAVSRPATEEEAKLLSSRGWLRSPHMSNRNDWFDRRSPHSASVPVGLALILAQASASK